jgi:hypothetical protein
VSGSADSKIVPAVEAAKTPQPPQPDGRAEVRRRTEAAERERWEAALYLSRMIQENLGRIDRHSEERMRIDLMKAEASDASPPEVLIRLRSSEILLKMRWCNGDVASASRLANLFRSCQFNQAQDAFSGPGDNSTSRHGRWTMSSRATRAKVRPVSPRVILHRGESCATYALQCCGWPTRRRPRCERLWVIIDVTRTSRSAGYRYSGNERLWPMLLRARWKQHELVLDRDFDADSAKPVREAFVEVAERFATGRCDVVSCSDRVYLDSAASMRPKLPIGRC